MNKEKIISLYQNNPIPVFFLSLCALGILWFGVITTGIENSSKNLEKLPQLREEMLAINDLSSQIRRLEASVMRNPAEQKASNETLLKRMETLAQETKVFAKISRVTPTTVRQSGRDVDALILEFEQLSMAALTPFLHAISHKSLLEVSSLDLRRVHEEDGMMSVRMTITDG